MILVAISAVASDFEIGFQLRPEVFTVWSIVKDRTCDTRRLFVISNISLQHSTHYLTAKCGSWLERTSFVIPNLRWSIIGLGIPGVTALLLLLRVLVETSIPPPKTSNCILIVVQWKRDLCITNMIAQHLSKRIISLTRGSGEQSSSSIRLSMHAHVGRWPAFSANRSWPLLIGQ